MDADERDLVLRARNGEVGAFSTLVERHWFPLVRFARSIVGDPEAEDFVQDALVSAWSNISALRHPEAFGAWLTRCVARRCFSWTRRSFRVLTLAETADPPDPLSESAAEGIEVERVLSRLAPRQRAVMHLTLIEGMTDSEIAQALGITAASVRSHRRRAREALRHALAPAEARESR